MDKLDPQLRRMIELARRGSLQPRWRGVTPFEVDSMTYRPVQVRVLIEFLGDVVILANAGLKIATVAGDVISGQIPLERVEALSKIDGVVRVEIGRPMHRDLDVSIAECEGGGVFLGQQTLGGAGVVVAIVDSGCDYTHGIFRDAQGRTRIKWLWDQTLDPIGPEQSPAPFGYGVEYNAVNINAALDSNDPFAIVRHRGSHHGTHVAGIAAGNGIVSGYGKPAKTYIGMAPDADILIVCTDGEGSRGFGTSVSALDAVSYAFARAASVGRPCVVNMSLGDNIGSHDGTAPLERGLDAMLQSTAGRAFVKSAGNNAGTRCHARGHLNTKVPLNFALIQPASDQFANQIDVWYSGGDKCRVSVLAPTGDLLGPVEVDETAELTASTGDIVYVDHRGSDPVNGDKRAFVIISPPKDGNIAEGKWGLLLEAQVVTGIGRVDAWVQRGGPNDPAMMFLEPNESVECTISIPGTASSCITVGNYSSRDGTVPFGTLATNSGRGPTRDGRIAPTLCAPGVAVISGRAYFGVGEPYMSYSGSSMSAPHVAGAIALLLEVDRGLTQLELRAILQRTAREDAQTSAVPNLNWGYGKLNVRQAVGAETTAAVQGDKVPETTADDGVT